MAERGVLGLRTRAGERLWERMLVSSWVGSAGSGWQNEFKAKPKRRKLLTRSLDVNGNTASSSLGKIRDPLFGVGNHEVAIEEGIWDVFAERLDDRGAQCQVRNKVTDRNTRICVHRGSFDGPMVKPSALRGRLEALKSPPVHDVHVQIIGTEIEHSLGLVPEIGKVGRQHRRGDLGTRGPAAGLRGHGAARQER